MHESFWWSLRRITICAGLCFACGSLVADEAPLELNPLITTAARMPQTLAEATVPMLIISRAEIERSQASDLGELLRFHAGIDIGRNGGPGQNTGMFLRGSESNHTLVLVDGVEINPGTLGGAAIHNLRADIIERIEIVKGPRSALWGSEAIGGVLNIITRSAQDGHGWSADIGAGRYGARSVAAESRIRGALGGLAVGFSNFDSEGFPTRKGSSIDRAHDNTTVTARADTAIGSTTIAARYWEARGNTEYLDFFLAPVEQDYLNSALASDIGMRFSDNWSSTLTLSQTRDEIFQLDSDDYVTTGRRIVDWQNNWSVRTHHSMLAGISFSEEQTESLSFGDYFGDTTRTRDLYVSDYVEIGQHRLLLSVRHTDHDAFGSAFTWNIEQGLQISPSARLTLGLGTAYRAPDGTDRFGFGGNPDLRPERARNAELGVHFVHGRARFGASVYRNNIEDLVEYVFDPLTFEGGNINVGRARIRGLDLNYELVENDWSWRIAALLQDPENAADGSTLARRARRSLSSSVTRKLQWGELSLDLLASGARRDTPFSDTMNAGYVLANLNTAINLGERLTLRLKLENLLNSDYETAAGFNSAGRGVFLGLSYTSY